ncbi:MAG: aspartyl protease family protein [Verrucomicrobia bacterium]|nr:aspartyl protease family protein [Verrucomicrobiota bacterium]
MSLIKSFRFARHTHFSDSVVLTTGAYSYSLDAGPLSGVGGFDGQSFWMRDAKGVVLPQNAPARHGIASEMFQGTEALYRPNYGGAQISYLGSRQDQGRTFDAISFLPAEGKAAQEWWFDANTNLLARKVITRNGMTTVIEYSDYQSVGGLMIAHKIVVSHDTGPQENADVTAAVANPPDLTEHFRRPASSANDFALSGETTVPIDIIDDHIYIDLMLNGKGPFHFIFDTGGRNMVDPTVAYQAGARSIGSWRSGGVGPHATVVQYTQIDQVQIGSATLSAQPFEIRELGPRTSYGSFGTTPKRELQGLIGYELPARFIVTIDYTGRRMIIRNADQSQPGSAVRDVPLGFRGTWPLVKCSLAGFDGTCLLDTGSSAVMISKPFIDAHPAVMPRWFTGAAFIPIMPMEGVVARGFGGRSKGQVGTLVSVQLGSHTVNGIEKTIFSMDERGVGADPYISAIVGNLVLEHFAVTFDYPHGWLGLSPPGSSDSH